MLTTRYARVQHSVAELRSTDGTFVSRAAPVLAGRSVRELFEESQRVMASSVREEPREGLFVFAAHARLGAVGRLWLQATDVPRVGVVGRHDQADLALPLDEALSLRHVLFAVRRTKGGLRFSAFDLATPSGLEVGGARARVVETEGATILRASDFVFFCLPTGGDVPWDSKAGAPFDTLQLSPTRVDPSAHSSARAELRVRVQTTTLGLDRVVTRADLSRGVLIGRYHRCDVAVEVRVVSRVHALVFELDGEHFIADCASTNGITRPDGRIVSIAPLSRHDAFLLAEDVWLQVDAA